MQNDRESVADVLAKVKKADADNILNRETLLRAFQVIRPRSCFTTGRESDEARHRFVSLWKIGAALDAAMTLAITLPGLLEITGGWEPDQPEVYPAWTIRWYPRGASGAGWHAAIETAATPGLALLATILAALARTERTS